MMKKVLLSFLVLPSAILAQTTELDSLIEKRARGIARINAEYKGELEKLRAKYLQTGNQGAANAAAMLLKTIKISEPVKPGGEMELENTWWNFKQVDQVLGVVCLRPGGKVDSQKYPGASWKVVDDTSIEWIYPDKRKMLMKFTSEQRNELSGTWEDGSNRRWMVKTEPPIN